MLIQGTFLYDFEIRVIRGQSIARHGLGLIPGAAFLFCDVIMVIHARDSHS
jgi:hypothetical protein